jgi:hypothetical protein
MATSPKAKSEAQEFFYLDKDGKRADADLHNPILADGDDKAAKAVSDKVTARILAKAAAAREAKKKANAAKRWPGLKAWARRLLRR